MSIKVNLMLWYMIKTLKCYTSHIKEVLLYICCNCQISDVFCNNHNLVMTIDSNIVTVKILHDLFIYILLNSFQWILRRISINWCLNHDMHFHCLKDLEITLSMTSHVHCELCQNAEDEFKLIMSIADFKSWC